MSEQRTVRDQQKMCVNGCDARVSPPSEVICRACQNRITETLQKLVARAEANGGDDE